MRILLVNAYLKDPDQFDFVRSVVYRHFNRNDDATFIEVSRATIADYLYEIGTNYTDSKAEAKFN
jgi:hypothetical protein